MLCWQLLEASYLLQLGYSIQHVYLPLIYYLSCSFGLFPKIYAASHVRWLDLEGLNKIRTRMPFDDVAWEQNDAIAHAWVAELFKPSVTSSSSIEGAFLSNCAIPKQEHSMCPFG